MNHNGFKVSKKYRGLSICLAFAMVICDIMPSYASAYNDRTETEKSETYSVINDVTDNDTAEEMIEEEDGDTTPSFIESEKYDVTANDLVETDESLFTWDGTVITGYSGDDTKIVIPAKATKIGDHAFEDSEVIKVQFASNNVLSIGEYAFACSCLESIDLPHSLKTIEKYAFYCSDVESIVFPESVQKIYEGAFRGRLITSYSSGYGRLHEISFLGNGIKYIGPYAFSYQSLGDVYLPDSLTNIGEYAFYYSQIERLFMPKNNLMLGRSCFSYAKINLLELNCISISSGYDEGCQFSHAEINSLVISSDVISIPNFLFYYTKFNEGITIEIPGNANEIGYSAFSWCSGLDAIEIKSNIITSIPNYFIRGSSVKKCLLPSQIESIGYGAFMECSSLIEVIFPNSLKYIYAEAFVNCTSLESVYFPYGLERIENEAFEGCAELSAAYVPSSVVDLGEDIFTGCDFDFTMYVVKNSAAHRYAVENNINYEFYDDGGTSLISVTYNLNGGENNYNNMDGYYVGEEVSLGYPYRNGYEFAGWYYDSKFESKVPASFTAEENITVYAKWKPIVYEIVYKLGAGKSNPNPTTYTIESDTIVLKNPVSDHGTFLGWYNGSGQKVTTIPKGSYGYIYLTARWQEAEYTISFSSNGGSGYMNSCTVTYSEEKTLPYCGFTKSGYFFRGWNTKADGKGKFFWDGETVSMLSSKKNGTVTLYAQWEIQTYYISYELNGGTQNSKNKSSYTIKTAVTLNNPTREGYTFKGWFNNSGLTGVKKTSIPKGSEGDVYLYANWEENHYKILYNINGKGATGTVPNAAVSFAEVVSLPDEEALTRPGYTLVGWNTKSNGKGESFEPGEGVSELVSKNNGSISLYAVWQAEQYDICYFNVDEADNSKNPDVYDTTKKISLKSPVMEGYTFKGWYENEALNGSKISMIKAGNVGEKNFYASWSENKYKLAFNKNSGSLTGELPAVTEYMYTDTVSLPNEVASRNGYWLSGWNTKANGQGTHYDVGDSVSGICGTNNKKITLYAEWTPIQYDVYYELDGGENNPANLDYHTSVASMTLKNPTKVGYTFKGWYTTEDFKASSKVSKIAKSDQPVTVYAKWQVNSYKISFNKNGGSGSMSTITAKYDETVNLPRGKFTRNGYVFAGWNTKANGTGDWYADEAEVVSLTDKNGKVVVLYAMWEKQ